MLIFFLRYLDEVFGFTVGFSDDFDATTYACLLENNDVCTPGQQNCSTVPCKKTVDSFYPNEAIVFLVCDAPSSINAPYTLVSQAKAYNYQSGGTGVACPGGYTPALGFTMQFTTDGQCCTGSSYASYVSCLNGNNKFCSNTSRSCNTSYCVTPNPVDGGDIARTTLACEVDNHFTNSRANSTNHPNDLADSLADYFADPIPNSCTNPSNSLANVLADNTSNTLTNFFSNSLSNLLTDHSFPNFLTNFLPNTRANSLTNYFANSLSNSLANRLANSITLADLLHNSLANPLANPLDNPLANTIAQADSVALTNSLASPLAHPSLVHSLANCFTNSFPSLANTLSNSHLSTTVTPTFATFSPTLSPQSQSLASTLSPTSPTANTTPGFQSPIAPTAQSEKSAAVAGGITAAVITPIILLCLAGLLMYWRRKARQKELIPRMTTDQESNDSDPREFALNGAIELCEQMEREPNLSAQHKLFLQSVIAGAKEDKEVVQIPNASGINGIMMTTTTPSMVTSGNQMKSMNMEDFEHVKFLSQGVGGSADLYKEKSTGQEVVIKVPHHDSELEPEIKVWASVGLHPNVARMIGIASLKNRPRGIVMQYYAKGSLESYDFEFSANELVRMAIGLARGLQFLHAHKVIHRDLAARNILVDRNGRVAITDFGLSRKLDEHDVYQMQSETKLPWCTLAPEIIFIETEQRRAFTEKTDIWALGVTLWELATKQSPYAQCLASDSFPVLRQKIAKGEVTLDLKPIIMNHPNLAAALIGCLNRDPIRRPTAEQLRWLLKDNYSAERDDREDYIASVQGDTYA